MRIVVVRHGVAQPKKGWKGSDDDRPLVGRGFRQAERLGPVVGRRSPTRILTSPALRCWQTVQPLADRHGVPVEPTNAFSIGAAAQAAALCRKLAAAGPPDANVVLCTHREVLDDLLPQLAEEGGRKLPGRPPGAKGGAWVLHFEEGRLVKVGYRPPAA